jgi:hypothetical protein
MNPKEKAIKLLDKYIQANGNSFFAKQCALIAVDELIKNTINTKTDYGASWTYWQQVKQEIENLLWNPI